MNRSGCCCCSRHVEKEGPDKVGVFVLCIQWRLDVVSQGSDPDCGRLGSGRDVGCGDNDLWD